MNTFRDASRCIYRRNDGMGPNEVGKQSMLMVTALYVDIYIYISGQIIATSHDLTTRGSLVGQIPLFQVFPGW